MGNEKEPSAFSKAMQEAKDAGIAGEYLLSFAIGQATQYICVTLIICAFIISCNK